MVCGFLCAPLVALVGLLSSTSQNLTPKLVPALPLALALALTLERARMRVCEREVWSAPALLPLTLPQSGPPGLSARMLAPAKRALVALRAPALVRAQEPWAWAEWLSV